MGERIAILREQRLTLADIQEVIATLEARCTARWSS